MFLSIQYLRAISAIGVVFFHTFGYFGNQGVAIFFVISGFIMFYIMDTKHHSYKDFLTARIVRVVPLYWLLTTLTLLLGIGYDPTIKRIILSYIYLSLVTVLPVGWTLTYEFIFYMSCVIVMFFVYKKNYRYLLIILLLIIGDLIFNIILNKYNFGYGHYFLLFVFGNIIYLMYKRDIILNTSYFVLYFLLFIMLILTFTDSKLILKYINYALNIGVPAGLVVWIFLSIEKKYGIKENQFLLFLGNASYSIYLAHYIVIHLMKKYFTNIDNSYLFGLSIIIGSLTYVIIEKPLLKITKRVVYKNV